MKTKRFLEYMNSKGKVDSPVVKLDGDRIDPTTMPNKPPGGGKEYAAKGVKTKTSDKGFADQGDKALEYNPKVDNDSKGKAPAKIPTVDEVAAVNKIVHAASKNTALIETIVRGLKGQNLLGVLVAEMLNHKETYTHLSEVMAHESYGPDLCTKLVRAMNEEVAAPFSHQLDGDDHHQDDDPDDLTLGGDLDDDDDLGDDEMNDDEEGGDGSNMDPDMDGQGMDPMMDMDPTMGGGDSNGMDPNADPSMMGGDPNMDPNMAMGMDPSMMGGMHPAMQNFQRAMMKAYMRKMMRKNMRKMMRAI